jgi:hypothetical protein
VLAESHPAEVILRTTELGLSKWKLGLSMLELRVSMLTLKLNTPAILSPAVLRRGKTPNQQAIVHGISMQHFTSPREAFWTGFVIVNTWLKK